MDGDLLMVIVHRGWAPRMTVPLDTYDAERKVSRLPGPSYGSLRSTVQLTSQTDMNTLHLYTISGAKQAPTRVGLEAGPFEHRNI